MKILALFILSASLAACTAAESLALQGEWRFELDQNDRGLSERWFNRALPERIQLPGVLQAQGFGDEINIQTPWILSLYDRLWYLRKDYWAHTNAGSVKVPFVCQPPRHYVGAAWYQREIEIPADWQGRRLMLHLERPRWESRVWINGQIAGTNNSLCAPHEFVLGVVNAPHSLVQTGRNILTVRVDNRMLLPYRPDAHAVSDSLNSTWNGIVGTMELQSTPSVWIDDLQLFPDAATGTVRVRVQIGNATTNTEKVFVSLNFIPAMASSGGKATLREMACEPGITTLEAQVQNAYPLKLWDEFDPALFEFTASIRKAETNASASRLFHARRVKFGFREFKRDGARIVVNGRETHLRGTHHGGDFPLTGYPPTDIEYWRKLIRTCQEWGQNHMRFHSFCPPKAAFEAADELGFYLQPEPGMWNTIDPNSPMERMLYLETERMLKAYGNHPSFVMFAASNEPKGRWRQVLPQWAAHFRTNDARRLYTTGTGFTDADAPGPMEMVDFTTTQRFGPRQVRRESGWFGRDYSGSLRGVNVPVIVHENGQWCAYPDFRVIEKFTGYMRPGNFEIFRDSAAANGVVEMNRQFAHASGRFQLACYKEEIEANLRTRGLSGFQLLDLHDYVGQGTALVGLLDPFWEPKGYATAQEFRRFCSETVPLARLHKRVFTSAENLQAELELAHFGANALTNQDVNWSIRDHTGKPVASGRLDTKTFPIGRSLLGRISVGLSNFPAPAAYQLSVTLPGARTQNHTVADAENGWNLWLYPTQDHNPVPRDVLATSSWAEAEKKLEAGGKVLFLPRNTDLDWSSPPLDDVPIFWNRLMNPGWSRMLGIWCNTNHPALARFPTDSHCDWQWTQIMRGVRPVSLAKLPRDLKPIVQAIDDWNRNWKLGAIFECRVGSGRLMVSAFDLTHDLPNRPVARQLCRSLLDYMGTDEFNPKVSVSAAAFRGTLFNTRIMRQVGASASGAGNVNQAIDGDPNTAWVIGGTGRNAATNRHPHTLTIEFPEVVSMAGFVIMPRQNDRDHLGDVREFRLETSDDGQQWTELHRGALPSTWEPHRIEWDRAVSARRLRFVAVSGYGSDPSAALGEFAILREGERFADDAGNMEFRRSRSTSTDVDEGN
ncbi:MAG TPA: discoidin domain-containing protein [Verrucomicrobiae bacterium]|nr:discoidin domain-containing protein [Verrucomicrobiae bacterium]